VVARTNRATHPILSDKKIDNMKKASSLNKTYRMSASAAKAKKITVDIPRSLHAETEQVVTERHITTSVFVREAMEHYLHDIKRAKLERELEEGYIANAALGNTIHREFEYVDAELA